MHRVQFSIILTAIACLLVSISANAANVSISTGDASRSVAVSGDGQYFYVGHQNPGTVVKYSTSQLIAVDSVTVGGDPLAIVITPNQQYLYVSNTVDLLHTSKIDLASMQVVAEIPGGTDPAEMSVSPNGEMLCIGTHWTNALQVVSVAADTQLSAIGGLGNGFLGVAISPDGQVAYAADRINGPNPGPGGVYKMSLSSFSLLGTIPVKELH